MYFDIRKYRLVNGKDIGVLLHKQADGKVKPGWKVREDEEIRGRGISLTL